MDNGLLLKAASFFLLLLLLDYVRIYFRPGLRTIPGPFLARLTSIWRFTLTKNGDTPARYRRLHKQYGQIVRTGPNHVSISDPAMIPVIYGISSKFRKVAHNLVQSEMDLC